MDLFNHQSLHLWLLTYGSLAIFVLLVLGILALPVPEETLLVITGMLIREGHLTKEWTISAAILGSIFGITGSYFIGLWGINFLMKKDIGKWLIKKKSLAKATKWFEKFGPATLFFGYFVPGVRHFTGIVAGATQLKYKKFALFAYSGGLCWASLFLTIGYFLETSIINYARKLYDFKEGWYYIILALLIVVPTVYFFIRKRKG
jgi:membrane protein DedA with SNARE-associated domain